MVGCQLPKQSWKDEAWDVPRQLIITMDNHMSITCHVFKLQCPKIKLGETHGKLSHCIRPVAAQCDSRVILGSKHV